MALPTGLNRVKIVKGKESIKVFPIDLPGWLKAGWKLSVLDTTEAQDEQGEPTTLENFKEVNKAPGIKLIEATDDVAALQALLLIEEDETTPRVWAVKVLKEQLEKLEDKEETL